jgi:hypothetical protein
METVKVTMIKKDAVIDIKVGAGFMGRLQQTLSFIIKPLTKEDIEKYTEELKNITSDNAEFSEPWMTALSCVSLLLKNLEEAAKQQGHTYEKELSEDSNKPDQLDDLLNEE